MMRNRFRVAISVWVALFIAAQFFVKPPMVFGAESALSLLSGFDAERLSAILGDDSDKPDVGELAKLLYRIDKLDETSLATRVAGSAATAATAIGDAVYIDGRVSAIKRVSVPEALVEFLEFKQYYRVDLNLPQETGSRQSIYVTSVPATIAAGDAVSATGVVIGIESADDAVSIVAIAAPKLRWTPAEAPSAGLKLLAEEGVDMAGVATLTRRNRQPLQNADSETFYTMMAAAASIAERDSPAPQAIGPAMLLQDPLPWIGQWIRLQADTVRITRIAVTEPDRQRQLGSDAYYQIDAIGDLGNVVIELQRPEGGPVRFENRFPISLVMASLPSFLQGQMRDDRGESVGIKLVSTRVDIDGFFFRLWSYESDRMSRGGEGEQIGPLVVAASIRSLEIPGADPIGVSKIGYIAAGAILIGLAFAWLWNRGNARSDAEARDLRDRQQNDDVGWLKDESDSSS